MTDEPWVDMFAGVLDRVTEPIFHYCDGGAVVGMVEGKAFRATEAGAMNDPREITQGLDTIQSFLKGQKTGRAVSDLLGATDLVEQYGDPGVYLLCASTIGDDVNQWTRYAAGGLGYAVELDPTVPLGVRARPEVDKPTGAGAFPQLIRFDVDAAKVTPWLPVAYDADVKNLLLTTLLQAAEESIETYDLAVSNPTLVEGLRTGNHNAEAFAEGLRDDHTWRLMSAVTILSQLMKEPGYAGENEVRAVVSMPRTDHAYFRPSAYGVARYVEVAACNDEPTGQVIPEDSERIPLPIRSVSLGPLLSKRGTAALEDLLGRNGLKDAKVIASEVPLR